jgi:SAM-dependent methyltransferase
MDKGEHRQRTLGFFRQAALEKRGFYDASDISDLRHSIWQRRARSWLRRRIVELSGSCASLVDVGCGNGDFVRELAAMLPQMEVRGCDFSPEMIEVAQNDYAGLPNLSYRTQDLLGPHPDRRRFDIVLCLNMFHHLHEDDLDRGMDALDELTGKVLLFEIKNENNLWNRRFRPTDDFPVKLLSPSRAQRYLGGKGLRFVRQWNIFGLARLSPIVILEFSRLAGPFPVMPGRDAPG